MPCSVVALAFTPDFFEVLVALTFMLTQRIMAFSICKP